MVELFVADDLDAELCETCLARAAERAIKAVVVPRADLSRLAATCEHQGVLARMGPFPYAEPGVLSAMPSDRALFLVLDAIQDPFNFGAMLRSAGAFGVDAVLISDQQQSPVTSQVARSSAGVVNRVPIVRTGDLPGLLQSLRGRGVRVVGASEKSTARLTECSLTRPTAIVIGNEGTGLSTQLLDCCDELVRIPIVPAVGSLNAAAAAAVVLYEAQRQRT